MSKYSETRLFVINNPNAPRLCPELAKEIGLNESILFLQLDFWIGISDNERDGKYWTYQSLSDIQEFFPFWSQRTIQRIIQSLKDKNLIDVAQYNKCAYDRTNWYALNEEGIAKLKSVTICPYRTRQNGVIEDDESEDIDDDILTAGTRQNAPTIPENTTEITTENNGEVWQQVLDELKLVLTRATFDTWVKYTTAIQRDGGWEIRCVNEYAREWMENRLAPIIHRTMAFILDEPPGKLTFIAQRHGKATKHRKPNDGEGNADG